MAAVNPNTPQGLVPLRRIDGAKWNDSARKYFVPAANTHALFVGDPVIKVAGSADSQGVNGVDLAAAGDGDKITGVVVGFVGSCAAGAANPGFFGSSGQPGPYYRPASTTLDYYVLVVDDPEVEFAIQSNDNGGIPAATIVGKNVDLVSGAGSQYTGLSGWQFDPNSAATTATHQFNITGVLQEIDNVVGLANCKFIGRINVSTEVNGAAGI